jgi:hypothetical protein
MNNDLTKLTNLLVEFCFNGYTSSFLSQIIMVFTSFEQIDNAKDQPPEACTNQKLKPQPSF